MDSPDIIVEAEVEGGITRMLCLYADMTDLPEQVGPTRSARPSFVQFSQFFDCLYVHFGQSHSKGDYEGADDYIKNNNVDNIDGMSTSSCFKRTKDKVSPHNAVLLGNELVAAIEKKATEQILIHLASLSLRLTKRQLPCRNRLAAASPASFQTELRLLTTTHLHMIRQTANIKINQISSKR